MGGVKPPLPLPLRGPCVNLKLPTALHYLSKGGLGWGRGVKTTIIKNILIKLHSNCWADAEYFQNFEDCSLNVLKTLPNIIVSFRCTFVVCHSYKPKEYHSSYTPMCKVIIQCDSENERGAVEVKTSTTLW